MSTPQTVRTVAILASALACLLPAGGCGGGAKKKGGLTIAQRLERARAEKAPENQARELVKVAELQARASDNAGAAKTLSEARGLLTPKPPKPAPRPEPAPEAPPGDEAPADGAAPADAGPTPPGEPGTEPPAPAEPDKPTGEPGSTVEPPAPAEPSAPAEPPAPAEPAPPAEPEYPVAPAQAGPILVDIAAVYASVGERSTAKDVLSQARKLLPKIEDVVVKALMLAKAGGIYGAKTSGLSDASNARRVLAEAATLTDQIEERFRPEPLAAVTFGYVTAGLAKDAAETTAKLETLARGAEARPKAEGLAVAATVRSQTGDTDGARELLAEASEAAKSIDSPLNRAYALMSVARASSGAGDRKAALALLKEAEKTANKVGDNDSRTTALEKVRAAQAEVDKKKKA